MSSPIEFPPPGFENVSIDEQLTYVEGLLNYIRGLDPAGIPKWQLEILEERLARYRASGVKGRSWVEFEQELENEFEELTKTN